MNTQPTRRRDTRSISSELDPISPHIRDRHDIEEELRASEARFRQVVEHIREVFWMSDPEKEQMLYVSPAYEAIWGRTCQSLYDNPKAWLEAIHPADRQRVEHAALTEQVQGAYDEVYRVVRPDGSVRWVEDRAFPIRDQSGKVYRLVGIAEDITARVAADEVLRSSEERFRILFESSPMGIALHNAEGQYLMVNQSYCEMLGYTESELIRLGTRKVTHPADVARGRLLYEELKREERDHYQREKRFFRKNGEVVYALSSASAVRHPDGRLRYIISLVVDISERRRMREEILNIGADERRRLGYDLHDGLGQYLSGIAFKAKCLEETLRSGSLAHAAAAHELVELINGAISQTRALARGLDPVEVEIGGLIPAVEHLVRDNRGRSDMECNFKCDIEEIPLNLEQALNLFRIAQEALNNAIKHSRARRVDVVIEHENNHLRLAVLDDGQGLATGSEQVAGLGLRTMRYRADVIGASISVRNRADGRGTVVECLFPHQHRLGNGRGRSR